MIGVKFQETTTGHVAFIRNFGEQDKIGWFIKPEKGGSFSTHRAEGGGFVMVPRVKGLKETAEYTAANCYYETLNDAKATIYAHYAKINDATL